MANIDIQPPAFHGLASWSYTGARVRRTLQSILADAERIVGTGDLLVAPSSPAAMSVQVAPGRLWLNGDAVVRQGVYLLEQSTALTGLTIATAHATLPRIDLVVARDFDSSPDGGSAGSDAGTIEVITGTPNASPVAPTVPGSAVALAEVRVNAAVTSILAASITDRRPMPMTVTPHVVAGGTGLVSSATLNLTTPTSERGGTFWSAGTPTRLTVPTLRPGFAGIYTVNAHVQFAADTGGTFRRASLRVNGVTRRSHDSPSLGATQLVNLPVADTLELVAGDYVEVNAAHDVGGPITCTWSLTATRIGA